MKYSKFGIILFLLFWGMFNNSFAQTKEFQQYLDTANEDYVQKKYNEAISNYQAIINLNSNNSYAYQMLGNCFYFLGRFDEALVGTQCLAT